jgi:hypothetical protein
MKEETVRKVMRKYFASKDIKIIPQRGAGPDFHIEGEGKVVEVKGSKYDFERMLRQLWDYAFKFVDVSLALPYDGLTLRKTQQLIGLSRLIEDAKDIRLRVYMVAPDPEQNNVFYIREFKYVSLILNEMGVSGSLGLGLKTQNLDSTKDIAIENLVKYSPVEMLRETVCDKYSDYVSVIQI